MTDRLQPMKPLARPATLRGPAIKPTGPRRLRVIEQHVGGPGDPPPGFVGGQTSATEWWCYWGLYKIFDERADPRKPPFFGLYPYFEYQSAEIGGYVRAVGSAVVDFLIHQGNTMLAIRLQTERFHQFTDAKKQGGDRLQEALLEKSGLTVVDVYDQDILGDPSGAKCIITLKRALGLIERVNPVVAGTAIRASRLKVLK